MTSADLAVVQAAVGDAHDRWADGLEGDVVWPERGLRADGPVWSEDALASDAQLGDLARGVRDGIRDAAV